MAEGRARFLWNRDDKVANLIDSMQEFKTEMEFQGKDFNADKVKLYEAVRKKMAVTYKHEPSFFGPENPTPFPFAGRGEKDFNEKEILAKKEWERQRKSDLKEIKCGYTRIQEKIKEIRQNFSTAVTSGRRSGSGRIVLEFYDQLVSLWGAASATKSLTCSISSDTVNNSCSEVTTNVSSNVSSSSASSFTAENETEQLFMNSNDNESLLGETGDDRIDADNSQPLISTAVKRKRPGTNPIPQLIDDKRKHLERQLNASQRDQLLINDSKEESLFRKQMIDAIKESNTSFTAAMNKFGDAMSNVANSFSKSLENMTRAMHMPDPSVLYNQQQNHFYNDSLMQHHRHAPTQPLYSNTWNQCHNNGGINSEHRTSPTESYVSSDGFCGALRNAMDTDLE